MSSVDFTLDGRWLAAANNVRGASGFLTNALHQALEEVAAEAVEIIIGNMHFDKGYSTGATEESTGYEFVGDLQVAIGPTTDYAGYVEEGTYKMEAEPFMAPSIPQIEAIAEQYLPVAVEETLTQITGEM